MDILETDTRYRRKNTADAVSRALFLLPFLASCGLYFFLWLPEPSWLSAGVKALPILSLVVFLLAQARRDGAWAPSALGICWGLLFSSVGDTCLVWSLFLPGMAVFAGGHVCYLWALGLHPLHPRLLLLGGLAWAGAYGALWPCLPPGVHVPAVGVYGALLAAVGWRALAHPAPRLAAGAGALLFMASDLALALDHFCGRLPHARLLVMATYYAAQGLLAFSAPRARPRPKET